MIVRLCFALLTALFVAASGDEAFAFSLGDSRITNTLTHGNLSVHVLHGQSGAGPAPLTLHQASGRGLARVHVQGKQIVASNAATQSVFIQAGTLLTGATQDQVVLQSLIVAPGASNIPLNYLLRRKPTVDGAARHQRHRIRTGAGVRAASRGDAQSSCRERTRTRSGRASSGSSASG